MKESHVTKNFSRRGTQWYGLYHKFARKQVLFIFRLIRTFNLLKFFSQKMKKYETFLEYQENIVTLNLKDEIRHKR